MRRKSTSLSTGSQLTIKNTGLRPSWDAFWALEDEINKEKTVPSPVCKSNTTSGTIVVKFVTGSDWIGEWDKLGMCGMGTYKMPHGVVYEGGMNLGLFEGIGVLKYPNGGTLEGFWHMGKLKYCQYVYADGLKRDSTNDWPYCNPPDRRFYSELLQELRPGHTEQSTNEDPAKELPPGHYDVGDGFYNPHTKCVTDPQTGEVLRIPTVAEEKWILENCRTAEIGTVGYRPDLYKNWSNEKTQATEQEEDPDEGDVMLKLILQEGGALESASSTKTSRARSLSLQSKIECLGSLGGIRSSSMMWSRSTMDVEMFFRNFIRDLSYGKLSILRSVASLPKSQSDSEKSEFTDLEQRTLENLVSITTKRFSFLPHTRVDLSKATLNKHSSRSRDRDYHLTNKDLESLQSEFYGSRLHYNIDYTDYEPSIQSKSTH